MLKIRLLHPDDSIPKITKLLHRSYSRLGGMGLNYTAVDQTPEVTSRRIADGHCLIAERAGKLAGTVVATPTYAANQCEYFTRPGVASAHQFAVEPSFQGKGIGRTLLAACEEWAAQQAFRELAIDTAEQASHLIALYARLGYRHVGHVQWSGKVYRSVVLSKIL